jgi:GntR family transcriptional regulator
MIQSMAAPKRQITDKGPTPKYGQLHRILAQMIETELEIDEALPSERLISERYGIARMTVRQAIDQLVAEGRVYKVAGKGAFVARPHLVMPLTLTSFTKDMQERGSRAGSIEITRRPAVADASLSRLLHVSIGEPLHELRRVRLADDEPLAIEHSHLVARRAPGLLDTPLGNRSLYAELETRYGLRIDGGDQTISAGLADPDEAALLGVPHGSQVLRFQRRSFANGEPLEYAVSTYRGDRYQLSVSFEPSPAAPL